MNLRQYQKDLSDKATKILRQKNIVYLAMEVRTGKTLTSLKVAENVGAKKVLFLTKKKAVQSVVDDYNAFGFSFELTVINDESSHKVDGDFDLVIHDEHHRFGAFPKPNKFAKDFKKRFSKLPQIYLSGTPHPESYSQIYHQFWTSDRSPFKSYSTFYKWAKDFVYIEKRNLGYAEVNDYSNAKKNKIKPIIEPYFITYSQEEAGFKTEIKEHFLYCTMKQSTYDLADTLMSDKVYKGAEDVVLADTSVKLQQKLHQIYSGTIITESGQSFVIDNTKALFIKDEFKGKKIAIFYKFKKEYDALKGVLRDDLTNDLKEFKATKKSIALQMVSGREGVNLSNADCLVYYNIDFSAVTYFQSRARLSAQNRNKNDVYWVFSESGIEEKIYKAVSEKKSYTADLFKKDYD